MKESTFKIVVLSLLLVVFTAVVITARWADESDYDQISCPSQDPDDTSSQEQSPQHQTGDLSARADAGWAESEAGSAVTWTDPGTKQFTRIRGASSRARHLVKAKIAPLALQKLAPFVRPTWPQAAPRLMIRPG